jgi:carboxyl-terminal processing protease
MMNARVRRWASLSLCALIAVCLSAPAFAERRVALVIGNGTYRHAQQLPNPANDARDVADALKRLGFETILGVDLDRAGMDDHAVRFARAAREADVAMFYYSGHAMQFAGVNYLIPVEAKLTDEADLRRLAKVDDIVADLQQAKNLRILVLDSCRNNPLAEELQRSIGRTRAASLSRGLAKIDAPQGMIVAYATQSGRTAEDGIGRNSPYTSAFLRYVEAQEEIGTVFRRVSADVYDATQRTQLPELSLSLIGEFYLKGRPQLQAAVPPPSAPSETAAAQAWGAMKDTASLAVLEAFIQQYGDSIYGPFARARRDELKRSLSSAAPVQAPPPAEPAKSVSPRFTRADMAKLFTPFGTILERVRSDYVEPPDEPKLLLGAIDAMRTAFPSAQRVSSTGPIGSGSRTPDRRKLDINALHDAALDLLNGPTSAGDDARALQSAIKGLFAALDPHSSYMDAQAFRDMQVQTRGSFGGLGVEVTMENEQLKVVAPIDDTPASKAGLISNDIITHLDDAPLAGLTLNDAVGKMRGPVGSTVRLTIKRAGRDRPFDVAITRDTIRVRAVRMRIEGNDVGYIRITQFNELTVGDLKKAIGEIKTQLPGNRLKGYVIDLRNNPGGLLNQAIEVADEFLERGEVVSVRPRKAEQVQRFSAKAGDLTVGKRVVVLINGGSAAASEILAGALQDHKRATILGARSFGKGSVQTIIPLGTDAGAIRLTTARYFTPSGSSIQAKGIVPDIEVLEDVPDELKDKAAATGEAALKGHLPGASAEQRPSQSYVPPDPRNDKALGKALEILRSAKR